MYSILCSSNIVSYVVISKLMINKCYSFLDFVPISELMISLTIKKL